MQKYLKILGILFEERDRLEKKRMRINPYKAGSDEKIKKLDMLIKENNQLIDQFEKIVKLFLEYFTFLSACPYQIKNIL